MEVTIPGDFLKCVDVALEDIMVGLRWLDLILKVFPTLNDSVIPYHNYLM